MPSPSAISCTTNCPTTRPREVCSHDLPEMIYEVRHNNTIRYSGFVHLAQFNVRLRPAPWPSQIVTNNRRFVDPLPWTVQEEEGAYVVNEARLTLRDPITQL